MIVESQKTSGQATAERPAGRLGGRRRPTAKHDTAELGGPAQFLIIVAQLFLLAVLIYRYNLESPAFVQLAVLAFAGFVVHDLLPMPLRLPFFAVLSLAGIAMV